MVKEISTFAEFIEWAEQFPNGQYLFRGVSNEKYKIEASASRRLGENSSNPVKLLKLNEEVIKEARLQGHDEKNGRTLSDLELLAELQHYGAATCLIDFTHSAQVALWFACQQSSSKKQENGKVIAVHSDDPVRFKKVTPQSLEKKLHCFFQMVKRRGYLLYQWEPKQQNNRIIAQQSVFLFGGAQIEAEAECIILKSSKEAILTSLDKSSGITEARMFLDFDGFARLRTHNRLYVEPDAQNHLQRGIEAFQESKWIEAIDYFDAVISLDPEASTLTQAYCYRGFVYDDKGESNKAIEDFTKAIDLQPNDADVYYYRGLSYADQDEYSLAIKDFTKSIELKPDYADVYNSRGAVYLKKYECDPAIKDFTKAIELKPDYASAYYNRGFVYETKSAHDLSIKDYSKTIELVPECVGAYYNRGGIYRIKYEFGSAIKDYSKVIELNSVCTDAYFYRGLSYADQSKHDLAIKDFTKAIELKPDKAGPYYHRAIAWLFLKNWERAKTDLAAAQNEDFNIDSSFHNKYKSVENFEQKIGATLSEDIVNILSRM